jgi:hypothetical protein
VTAELAEAFGVSVAGFGKVLLELIKDETTNF